MESLIDYIGTFGLFFSLGMFVLGPIALLYRSFVESKAWKLLSNSVTGKVIIILVKVLLFSLSIPFICYFGPSGPVPVLPQFLINLIGIVVGFNLLYLFVDFMDTITS